MSDVKWYLIAVICVFGGMFAGMAYEAYVKEQCRIAYAQSSRSATEITAICDGKPTLALSLDVTKGKSHD
jgi:hypothetical protein